jgi:sugar/nucleoside kinase (ribokinase family)
VTERRIVCLGEALVDFVCERPVASLGDADSFVPRQGGSLANIAVAAARFCEGVEMVGGAGDDEWGRWLRERIAGEGVGVDRFLLVPGAGTSHAFVAISAEGEPEFEFYGDSRSSTAYAEDLIEGALSGEPGVLVVGSDTLHGSAEREATMAAARLARDRGWEVICDPNLRPKRWGDEAEMVRVILGLVEAATAVKLNDDEATRLTGETNAATAALRLRDLGPRTVVVTCGPRGAVALADEGIQQISGVEAALVDATGAGDSVCGVLAAGIAKGLPIRPTVAAAMEVAARVVGEWGATTRLPSPSDARALLREAQEG